MIYGINFSLDNIFVINVFRQLVGIPMGTNCALNAGLFLYWYESQFMNKKTLYGIFWLVYSTITLYKISQL